MNNTISVEVQLRQPEIPTKWVPLTQDKIALVDDEDYEELMKHKWHVRKDGNTWYAARRCKNSDPYVVPFITMHRYIMGVVDQDIEIDHINRDGLDNRRSNLRLATRSQNAVNNDAKYKGVVYEARYKTRPYKARFAGKYLGQFATREEAEAVYEDAKREANDY